MPTVKTGSNTEVELTAVPTEQFKRADQPVQLTGEVVVIFDPDRDVIPGQVRDAKGVRLFHFSVVEEIIVATTGQKVSRFHTITLKPGANRVDRALLEQGLQQSLVQTRLKMGAIRVKNPLKEIESPQGNINEYSLEDALDIIEYVWDVLQLELYLRDEQRYEVRNAISRRIQQLKTGEAV